MKRALAAGLPLLAAVLLAACAGGEPQSVAAQNAALDSTAPNCSDGVPKADIGPDVPDWIRENFTCISARVEGDELIIETRSQPPYASYYYGQGSAQFTALPSDRRGNPNRIEPQVFRLHIPLQPEPASDYTDTQLDAIGVAVNGVALFNNQAAPGDTLADEMVTFDAGQGHPTPNGTYHYHTEPLLITDDDGALVGILRDGFPVYGQRDEDGTHPDDLDRTNGHTHATRLFPDGIYHYHVTPEDPYIASHYRGTPGDMEHAMQGGRQGPPGRGPGNRPPRSMGGDGRRPPPDRRGPPPPATGG